MFILFSVVLLATINISLGLDANSDNYNTPLPQLELLSAIGEESRIESTGNYYKDNNARQLPRTNSPHQSAHGAFYYSPSEARHVPAELEFLSSTDSSKEQFNTPSFSITPSPTRFDNEMGLGPEDSMLSSEHIPFNPSAPDDQPSKHIVSETTGAVLPFFRKNFVASKAKPPSNPYSSHDSRSNTKVPSPSKSTAKSPITFQPPHYYPTNVPQNTKPRIESKRTPSPMKYYPSNTLQQPHSTSMVTVAPTIPKMKEPTPIKVLASPNVPVNNHSPKPYYTPNPKPYYTGKPQPIQPSTPQSRKIPKSQEYYTPPMTQPIHTPIPPPYYTSKPLPIQASIPKPYYTSKPQPIHTPKPQAYYTSKPLPIHTPKSQPIHTPRPHPVQETREQPYYTPRPHPVQETKKQLYYTPRPHPIQETKKQPIQAPRPHPIQETKKQPYYTPRPHPIQETKKQPIQAPRPHPIQETKKQPIQAAKPKEYYSPRPIPTQAPKSNKYYSPKPLPIPPAKPQPVHTPKQPPYYTPMPLPMSKPITLPISTPMQIPTRFAKLKSYYNPRPLPNTTSMPQSINKPTPHHTSTPKPQSYYTPKPQPYYTPKPKPDYVPNPASIHTASPLPNHETTQLPIPTSKPQAYYTSQPIPTPKPQSYYTPMPQPIHTPMSQPIHTPKPQPSHTPKPQPIDVPSPLPIHPPKTQTYYTPNPLPVNIPKSKPYYTPKPLESIPPTEQPIDTPAPQPYFTPNPKPIHPPPVTNTSTNPSSKDTESYYLVETVKSPTSQPSGPQYYENKNDVSPDWRTPSPSIMKHETTSQPISFSPKIDIIPQDQYYKTPAPQLKPPQLLKPSFLGSLLSNIYIGKNPVSSLVAPTLAGYYQPPTSSPSHQIDTPPVSPPQRDPYYFPSHQTSSQPQQTLNVPSSNPSPFVDEYYSSTSSPPSTEPQPTFSETSSETANKGYYIPSSSTRSHSTPLPAKNDGSMHSQKSSSKEEYYNEPRPQSTTLQPPIVSDVPLPTPASTEDYYGSTPSQPTPPPDQIPLQTPSTLEYYNPPLDQPPQIASFPPQHTSSSTDKYYNTNTIEASPISVAPTTQSPSLNDGYYDQTPSQTTNQPPLQTTNQPPPQTTNQPPHVETAQQTSQPIESGNYYSTIPPQHINPSPPTNFPPSQHDSQHKNTPSPSSYSSYLTYYPSIAPVQRKAPFPNPPKQPKYYSTFIPRKPIPYAPLDSNTVPITSESLASQSDSFAGNSQYYPNSHMSSHKRTKMFSRNIHPRVASRSKSNHLARREHHGRERLSSFSTDYYKPQRLPKVLPFQPPIPDYYEPRYPSKLESTQPVSSDYYETYNPSNVAPPQPPSTDYYANHQHPLKGGPHFERIPQHETNYYPSKGEYYPAIPVDNSLPNNLPSPVQSTIPSSPIENSHPYYNVESSTHIAAPSNPSFSGSSSLPAQPSQMEEWTTTSQDKYYQPMPPPKHASGDSTSTMKTPQYYDNTFETKGGNLPPNTEQPIYYDQNQGANPPTHPTTSVDIPHV